MKYLKLILFSLVLLLGAKNVFASNTYSTEMEADSAQYWTKTDNASLSITGDLTIEFWIKFESLPGGAAEKIIIAKDKDVGNQSAYRIRLQNVAGALKFQAILSNDGSSATTCTTDDTGIVIDTWYHFAFVYDTSDLDGFWYKDGNTTPIQTCDGTQAASIFDSNATFTIGNNSASHSDGNNYLDAKMDDIRLWATIKSGAEIAASYQTELVGNETNLNGYWKFNNDGTDETANANDLTNNNSATFTTDVPFGGSPPPPPPGPPATGTWLVLPASSEIISQISTSTQAIFDDSKNIGLLATGIILGGGVLLFIYNALRKALKLPL